MREALRDFLPASIIGRPKTGLAGFPAFERWKKTGEGEGGIVGIECTLISDGNGGVKRASSHIVEDYNCGGMFRAMINKDGKAVCRIWKPGQYDGLDIYEEEGKEYDVRQWLDEKL